MHPEDLLSELKDQLAERGEKRVGWVGGDVVGRDRIVVLAHVRDWSELVGFSWRVREEFESYLPRPSVAQLAGFLVDAIVEPSRRGARLDVNWARMLVPAATRIVWLAADDDALRDRLVEFVDASNTQ